jgi:hypothetical protein
MPEVAKNVLELPLFAALSDDDRRPAADSDAAARDQRARGLNTAPDRAILDASDLRTCATARNAPGVEPDPECCGDEVAI